MRKSFYLAPLLAAGLVFACSSSSNRSGFAQQVDPTEKADSGPTGPRFQAGEGQEANEDGGCSSSQTQIARTPVVIEFVVDQSGSMMGEKWTAAQESLLAAFEDMKKNADPATFVGLELYSTAIGKKVAPGPLTTDKQYDKLTDTVSNATATGGTGTEAALEYAYDVVENFKPPASAGLDTSNIKRIVILMSDGVPDTPQAGIEQLAADKFAMTPPEGPVLTFSVGIGPFPTGSGYDPKFMSRIAQSGGTAPAGCDPEATDENAVCHFQVTPGGDVQVTKQKLIDAINKIRALSASCEFSFKVTGDADLKNISVTMTAADGTVVKIPKDPDNGWTFDDADAPTKVLLHGDACSTSNGTVSGRVDVTLGCKGAQ